MNIKHHGKWVRYTPAELPPNAPPNTLFTRRDSDQVDWYVYSRDPDSFAKDSIKLTLINGVVGAAGYDPVRLFPGNADVLEISNVTVADPQSAFGRKLYDPVNQTFNDQPPLPEPPPPAWVNDILKRLEALENKGS